MAHQKLGIVERKRNRGNSVTDIHHVVGENWDGIGNKTWPNVFQVSAHMPSSPTVTTEGRKEFQAILKYSPYWNKNSIRVNKKI